jgi:hypothetical protein
MSTTNNPVKRPASDELSEPPVKKTALIGYGDGKVWCSSDDLVFTRLSPLERTQLQEELQDGKFWYDGNTFGRQFTRMTEDEIFCKENGYEQDPVTGEIMAWDEEAGEDGSGAMVPVSGI